MKTFPRHWLALSGLIAVLAVLGCNVEQALQDLAGKSGTGKKATFRGTLPPRDPATIRMASFNIQVFGVSKLDKPEVMDVLAQVVRQFDVVAIQEVRATDETVVPQFVEWVNREGGNYAHVVGPRLGRTNSKEQYAFVYDTERLELSKSSIYTVDDPQDLLHREPLVARFRARGPAPAQAFTFSLMDIHTDPDETKTELDALADVFVGAQHNGSREDDIILLGDLNVDDQHLGRLGQFPTIAWTVSGTTTNTRRTQAYDNIVFDQSATVEFTGEAGVLDLIESFGLTEKAALEISDHFPIWATFSAYENSSAPIATSTGNVRR